VLNLLNMAAIVAFGLAAGFPMAFAVLLFRAPLLGLAHPLVSAWLVQHIDPRVRATVLSMFGQSNALGQIAGGPVVGWVGAVRSLRAAIVLAGLLLSPASLFYAYALRSPAAEPAGLEGNVPSIEPSP
jgi:hypothetical protein